MLKYKMPVSVAREFVRLAIPEQALFHATISVEIDKNGDGHIFMHDGITTTFIGAIPRFNEKYHDFLKSHLDQIEVIESTRGAAKSFRFYHKHRLMLEYISEKEKRDMTAELEHLIEERYLELKKKA